MKSKPIAVKSGFALLLFLLMTTVAGATNYTLTVFTQGSGTVAENPTNTSYPANVTVTLTALPSAGWYFANWSGDASGSVNPLNVIMTGNLVITGSFLAYPIYSLALATNGQGGIAVSPPGGSYLSNTVATATATAATGWVFAGWTGATNSNANPVSFAVNTSGTLTGTFAELPMFDVEPVSVTNQAGSTINFTAHSVGTAPLSYEWYFSGGALTTIATNATLSLTNIGTAQGGSYWVVATNNYGSATSQMASLTLTNSAGPTNRVSSPTEASLLSAIAAGGWVGIQFNGTLILTNTIIISNNVVLDGTGFGATISGGNLVRLFYVTNGASLTVSNLTLANGSNTYGGAIDADTATVALVGCLLTNNEAYAGGAVYNNGGVMTMCGSVFSYNSVTGNGCSGGAAYQASGSIMISNCIFSFNSATNTGTGFLPVGGGALALSSGNISINRSQFIENQVSGFGPVSVNSGCSAAGGAIYSTATLTANDSSFFGNRAIADNRVAFRSPGPGAADGGAIHNEGNATFKRCSICSNSAQGGYTSPYLNSASMGGLGYGGGIYNASYFSATNCTIALNSSTGGGAGGFGAPEGTNGTAMGGGVYNNLSGTFIAMNLTIASNACVSTAGQYSVSGIAAGSQIANATNGTLSVHNTLIAYSGAGSNAYGPITDGGYNICSDGSAGLFGGSSYNYTDPQLGPLGNYGGPTLCMALSPDSPAIDNGDINGCPNTDQRGYLRPFGSGPDMGAYEYGSALSTVPYLKISATTTNVTLTFPAFPASTYYLQCSTNLTAWVSLSTNGPVTVSTNISQTIGRQGVDRCFFRLLLQ